MRGLSTSCLLTRSQQVATFGEGSGLYPLELYTTPLLRRIGCDASTPLTLKEVAGMNAIGVCISG